MNFVILTNLLSHKKLLRIYAIFFITHIYMNYLMLKFVDQEKDFLSTEIFKKKLENRKYLIPEK